MRNIWEWLEWYTDSFWTASEEVMHIAGVVFTVGISVIAVFFVMSALWIMATGILEAIKDKLEKHKSE